MLQTSFETTEDAIEAVVAYSRDQGEDFLAAVPFERFDRSDTTWWLVPSRKPPHYRYGKVAFVSEGVPARAFVGFCVEKGLHGTAIATLARSVKAGYLMQEDWTWHAFLRSLQTGAFRADLERLRSRAKHPVFVQARAEALSRRLVAEKSEVVRVHYDARKLRVEPDGSGAGLLGLAEGDSLRALGDKLAKLPDADWTWITFMAGLLFDVVPPRTPGAWDAEDLWENAVKPWSSWLR